MADERESNFVKKRKEFIESCKPPTPPKQTKPSINASTITVELEVDSNQAVKNLKKIQRELKSTIKLFRELNEVSSQKVVIGHDAGGIVAGAVMAEIKNQERIKGLNKKY